MTTQKEATLETQDALLEGLTPEGGVSAEQAATPEGAPTEGQTKEQAEKTEGRTFTEAEWTAREKAREQEIVGIQQQLAEITRRSQEAIQAIREEAASALDARAVADGEITQAEATARQQRRAAEAAEQLQRAQERQAHARMMAEGERVGRIVAAYDLAQEFGVDAAALLNAPDISNVVEMKILARQLALDKREAELKGTETYDKGPVQSGASGPKSYVDKLKSGAALPPAEEIDRITAKYLRR